MLAFAWIFLAFRLELLTSWCLRVFVNLFGVYCKFVGDGLYLTIVSVDRAEGRSARDLPKQLPEKKPCHAK